MDKKRCENITTHSISYIMQGQTDVSARIHVSTNNSGRTHRFAPTVTPSDVPYGPYGTTLPRNICCTNGPKLIRGINGIGQRFFAVLRMNCVKIQIKIK